MKLFVLALVSVATAAPQNLAQVLQTLDPCNIDPMWIDPNADSPSALEYSCSTASPYETPWYLLEDSPATTTPSNTWSTPPAGWTATTSSIAPVTTFFDRAVALSGRSNDPDDVMDQDPCNVDPDYDDPYDGGPWALSNFCPTARLTETPWWYVEHPAPTATATTTPSNNGVSTVWATVTPGPTGPSITSTTTATVTAPPITTFIK